MACKLFLHEKTVEILLTILHSEEKGEKIYPLQISNLLDSPYSYISKVIGEFEKNFIVESKVEGRTRYIRLTDFGKRIAVMLRELKKELGQDLIALARLETLKKIFENGQKDFYTLAPIIAELEILASSTKDEPIRQQAISFKQKLEELLC
ncbi:MAG: winged helix-turn-helix domain-containing protein [Archaeoglobaceae archaeon]